VKTLNGAHSHLRVGEYRGPGNVLRRCAVKEASITRSQREQRSRNAVSNLEQEDEILRSVHGHPSIIENFGVCDSNFRAGPSSGAEEEFFQLVLEECTGGTLHSTSSNFASFGQRMEWLQQIADAMSHIHKRSVIHVDLKPSNVLLKDISSRHVKLSDFDSACQVCPDSGRAMLTSSLPNQKVGTLTYMSPELLAGSDYGKPTDVYSFGILMYELLEQRIAHFGKINAMPSEQSFTREAFADAVINHGLRPGGFSDRVMGFMEPLETSRLQELMFQCWHHDESHRLGFDEIVAEISDITSRSRRSSRKVLAAGSAPKMEFDVKVGKSEHLGCRKFMEDYTLEVSANENVLVGVLDGHGGNEIAKFSKERLKTRFHGDESPFDLLEAVDIDVQVEMNKAAQSAGTTASLLKLDRKSNIMEVAWVGDSDVVFCFENPDEEGGYRTARLTDSHKPESTAEKERVEGYGGTVGRNTRMQDDGNRYPYGPSRVYNEKGKGGLAVSRAIGDLNLRPYVSSLPSTRAVPLKAHRNPAYIILATDGVWDALDDDKVCSILLEQRGANHPGCLEDTVALGAEAICQAALAKGSQDNVSCVVVSLHSKYKEKK
jgi:serine/threonine protein kinase